MFCCFEALGSTFALFAAVALLRRDFCNNVDLYKESILPLRFFEANTVNSLKLL